MQTVHDVRDLEAAAPVLVTGDAAWLTDYQQALSERMPWALGIVFAGTFVLLFLFNRLRRVAAQGDRHEPAQSRRVVRRARLGVPGRAPGRPRRHRGAGQLEHHDAGSGVRDRVRPVDGLRGLPARADRGYLSTHDVRQHLALERGLQHTGAIVTAAGLLMVVVFAGFVAGGFSPVKQVGLGLVLAVAVDVTIVRMLLVPAAMTLMADRNWWAPRRLRSLQARFGLSEHGSLPTPRTPAESPATASV